MQKKLKYLTKEVIYTPIKSWFYGRNKAQNEPITDKKRLLIVTYHNGIKAVKKANKS